jgi:hypothetical protein
MKFLSFLVTYVGTFNTGRRPLIGHCIQQRSLSFFEEFLMPFYEGYLGIFHLNTIIDTGNALMIDDKKIFTASGH